MDLEQLHPWTALVGAVARFVGVVAAGYGAIGLASTTLEVASYVGGAVS